MLHVRSIPLVIVAISSFFVIGRSTEASLISSASAMHTLNFEVAGEGALEVVIEVIVDQLSGSLLGMGSASASATASLMGVDTPLSAFDSVNLVSGDSVTSVLEAVAERTAVGMSSADATGLISVTLSRSGQSESGDATVTMTYSAMVVDAKVSGADALNLGFATAYARFEDFDMNFSNMAQAEVDSAVDGNTMRNDPITATQTVTLSPGDSIQLFFDAEAHSKSTSLPPGVSNVPEPASAALWSLLGLCCCLGKRLLT